MYSKIVNVVKESKSLSQDFNRLVNSEISIKIAGGA